MALCSMGSSLMRNLQPASPGRQNTDTQNTGCMFVCAHALRCVHRNGGKVINERSVMATSCFPVNTVVVLMSASLSAVLQLLSILLSFSSFSPFSCRSPASLHSSTLVSGNLLFASDGWSVGGGRRVRGRQGKVHQNRGVWEMLSPVGLN